MAILKKKQTGLRARADELENSSPHTSEVDRMLSEAVSELASLDTRTEEERVADEKAAAQKEHIKKLKEIAAEAWEEYNNNTPYLGNGETLAKAIESNPSLAQFLEEQPKYCMSLGSCWLAVCHHKHAPRRHGALLRDARVYRWQCG